MYKKQIRRPNKNSYLQLDGLQQEHTFIRKIKKQKIIKKSQVEIRDQLSSKIDFNLATKKLYSKWLVYLYKNCIPINKQILLQLSEILRVNPCQLLVFHNRITSQFKNGLAIYRYFHENDTKSMIKFQKYQQKCNNSQLQHLNINNFNQYFECENISQFQKLELLSNTPIQQDIGFYEQQYYFNQYTV